MILSMTGFGDAACENNGTHYAAELRSLNNRYFKAMIKLPDGIAGLETELEGMLREKLGRGSITLVLKMRIDSANAAYRVNVPALESYISQLRQVKGLDGIARIDLAALLSLPGVCQEPSDESDVVEQHGAIIRKLTEQAIAKLMKMRKHEGESLFADLMKHIHFIADHLARIQVRAPLVIEDYHKRLSQRVNTLLSRAELAVAESDLTREVAVFAERADISEEIQRLGQHLKAFEQACRNDEHAGRKLDFIAQELLREANTIASKANDSEIAGHIVEIKGAIDRVKEQVQNVE